jgi:hypothetical protein
VGEVRRPLIVRRRGCAGAAHHLSQHCQPARLGQRDSAIAGRRARRGVGRIIRQLFTESLDRPLAGCAGTGLAYVAVRALAASGGGGFRAPATRIDGVVLAFTFAVSLLSGILFGALPAVRANGPVLEQALRAGARGSVGAGQRARSALVVVEVALAVVLVIGASLATKSFARLLSVKPGFDPTHALVARVSIPNPGNGAGADGQLLQRRARRRASRPRRYGGGLGPRLTDARERREPSRDRLGCAARGAREG